MRTMRMSLFAIAAVGAVNIGAATQVLWQNLGQVKQLRPALAIGANDDIIVVAGEVCGNRVLASGWFQSAAEGFAFIVRAHDIRAGTLLWQQRVHRGGESVIDASGLCVAPGGAPGRGNNGVGALVKTESPSQPETAGTF